MENVKTLKRNANFARREERFWEGEHTEKDQLGRAGWRYQVALLRMQPKGRFSGGLCAHLSPGKLKAEMGSDGETLDLGLGLAGMGWNLVETRVLVCIMESRKWRGV